MNANPASLSEKLKQWIEAEGPLRIDQWMEACLQDPDGGYYTTDQPFGRGGDFITAPEISQMFGELLGVWTATAWQSMGAPSEVNLIELGPGRGTLMSDALRAIKAVPDLKDALNVHLVETSESLREVQRSALADYSNNVQWHADLKSVPKGPAIILANEFLDALPIRQIVYRDGQWFERVVVWEDGKFAFALGHEIEENTIPRFDNAPEGAVFEFSPAVETVVSEISARLTDGVGYALLVDYGHTERALGETFQAVRDHKYAAPLENPGAQDLTAHVDFAAVGAHAEKAGAGVWGPVLQSALLEQLGIGTRTAALLTNATEAQAREIASARNRLVDTSAPESMGRLFKAIALANPDLPAPIGFTVPI